MRRLISVVSRLVLVLVVLGASAARADAITLTEIMELSRAGLSDEVLLALIEVDQRVFPIDPATLKTLRDAGVSQPVIVAIVKSGRTPLPPKPEPVADVPLPDPPEPQVVYVERPVVREVQVAVPVPVYVTLGTPLRSRHHRQPHIVPSSPFVPFGSPSFTQFPVAQVPEHRRAEPVYWGFGGKLRPDAWQPDPAPAPRKR